MSPVIGLVIGLVIITYRDRKTSDDLSANSVEKDQIGRVKIGYWKKLGQIRRNRNKSEMNDVNLSGFQSQFEVI